MLKVSLAPRVSFDFMLLCGKTHHEWEFTINGDLFLLSKDGILINNSQSVSG